MNGNESVVPPSPPLGIAGPDLADKRILIWGMGRHGGGLAAADWCTRHGAKVGILEQRVPSQLPEAGATAAARGWPWHAGNVGNNAIHGYDLVVPSPAIPPRALGQLPSGAAVCSPEAMFFASHDGPRVLVTGTKGKSTTAALTGHLLRWDVAGNSNEPLLAFLRRTGQKRPVVCELSSFQLWYLSEVKPRFDVAALTTLSIDHLDWHGSEKHYHHAKLQALDWGRNLALGEGLDQHAVDGIPSVAKVTIEGGNFVTSEGLVIAPTSTLPIPGAHNQSNACLALSIALHMGVEPAKCAERLTTFKGLPHRLETVHKTSELTFVDDSIATTPESAIAALSAMQGPVAIILGGSDKGASFSGISKKIKEYGAHPVCIGETARHICPALKEQGIVAPIAASMAEAIADAAALLADGGTVLLSPACASFGMFADFEERGDTFAALAKKAFPE